MSVKSSAQNLSPVVVEFDYRNVQGVLFMAHIASHLFIMKSYKIKHSCFTTLETYLVVFHNFQREKRTHVSFLLEPKIWPKLKNIVGTLLGWDSEKWKKRTVDDQITCLCGKVIMNTCVMLSIVLQNYNWPNS